MKSSLVLDLPPQEYVAGNQNDYQDQTCKTPGGRSLPDVVHEMVPTGDVSRDLGRPGICFDPEQNIAAKVSRWINTANPERNYLNYRLIGQQLIQAVFALR